MWVFNIKRALSVLFYLQSCTALTFLKTNLRLQNSYRHWDRIQGPNILGGPTYIHALHKVTDLWNCVMITYMTPLLWYWMLSMTYNDTCSKSTGSQCNSYLNAVREGKWRKIDHYCSILGPPWCEGRLSKWEWRKDHWTAVARPHLQAVNKGSSASLTGDG